MAWISGRESAAVLRRAEELGVRYLYQKALIKLPVYTKLLNELGLSKDRTAYIGDDLVDLPIMADCGFSVAVADAMDDVRAAADFITQRPGGHGAVAETIRFLLQAAGDWETLVTSAVSS